jgi:hypothetical protein
MLLEHQRKMAQMINSRFDYGPEFQAMRQELVDLRSLVNQQALQLDTLESKVRSLPQPQTTVNS